MLLTPQALDYTIRDIKTIQPIQYISEDTIKKSIEDYIKLIVQENIDDKNILCGVVFDEFRDNFIEQQRVYYFSSIQDGKKYAIQYGLSAELIRANVEVRGGQGNYKQLRFHYNDGNGYDGYDNKYNNTKQERVDDKMSATYLPASHPPPKLPLSPNITIDECFTLTNALPKLTHICNLCEKKYMFFNFGIHHNNTYVCKICCKQYSIKTKEDFENVRQIRRNVKNDLNKTKII